MIKKILKKTLVLGLFILLFGQAYTQIGDVILSFPSPGDDPTGLTWDGQYLWNADTETNKIYQIDPINGTIVYSIPGPPGATINGLTWDGNSIWCSDKENNCIYQINVKDSSIVHTIYLQTTNPRGLAFDGEYIWYQDSAQRSIFKLNPQADTYIDTLTSPGGYNRGLTWDGKYLWSSDCDKNEIYMLDPSSGSVIMILSAPGTYSYGLAFDGEFLWNADFETKKIYRISIQCSEKYQLTNPLQVKIRYSVKIKNVGSSTMDLKTFMACPFETVYQLIDNSLKFNKQPGSFFLDKYGQIIAYYQETVPVGIEKDYQWTQLTTLYNIRYFLHPDSVGTLEGIPQSIINMYTTDGEKYKITDPIITGAVQEAIGDETNLYWQVRRIHDYVISHIEYINDSQWDDAPTILTQGHGSCSEYSFLFIALCRATGIPARYEAGGHLRKTVPYEDRVFHRWQQVYFPNYGWVPIDCTWDDKQYPCNQARYFGAASNHAFSTTLGGGGEYGLWWSYNSANSSSGGSREREKLMEWLPYSTSVEMIVEQRSENHNTCFNYPNPFNSETVIRYYLPVSSPVTINIFNPMGQLIKSYDEGVLSKGWHRVQWGVNDDSGNLITSGIYFFQIEGNGLKKNGRMTLIR